MAGFVSHRHSLDISRVVWPIGWTIATVMSLLFCVNGIKKLKREKTGRIE